jgi:hypothetical protein
MWNRGSNGGRILVKLSVKSQLIHKGKTAPDGMGEPEAMPPRWQIAPDKRESRISGF